MNRNRRPSRSNSSHESNRSRRTARPDSALSTAAVEQRSVLAPDPAAPIPIVTLKSRISQTSVFRKQIQSTEGVKPGDLAAVYSKSKQLLGYGIYNPQSEMSLRMLWRGAELPTEASWNARLDAAVRLRQDILKLDEVTDTYRVIHAESDGLPGLMIDRFGDVLSAEAFSLGMYQRAQVLLDKLQSRLGTHHSIIRTSPQFLSQEGFEPPVLKSAECPDEVEVREHNTRFRVRFEGGHKTGFFCDQRDNRKQLAAYCEGKSVLDLCCYTGGFAVQAMKLGRASDAIGVDLDETPLKLASENAKLNQVRVRFVQSDAFNYMRDMIRAGRQFDVVILDPPKLIRSRVEIEEGTRRHFDLNRLAMRLVKPGGLMLSCTCSGLLTETEFIRLLCSAARQAGPEISPSKEGRGARHAARNMQIIQRTGAAPCHPVGSENPETDYLKAAWMVLD